jgi:hypothetical protein
LPSLRGRICLFLFLFVSYATVSHAQFDSSTILGTVRDGSGAVVPAASITLKSLITGVSNSTESNSAGDYAFNSVPAGEYVVSTQLTGFKDSSTSPFTVTVGARQRVDLNLVPGSVSEQVTVTTGTALLETDSSDRSMVIDHREVVNLPLNGRDPADLALLVPGVNKSSLEIEGATSREAAYNVNGLRNQVNSFLLDGLDNNSWAINDLGFSNQASQLSPDALSEFRFTTGNQSAEFGQSAGGLSNEVSRSGTNSIHGSAWDYVRNTVLNANGPIPPANGQKSLLIQNQFGGAIGGPIRHDKLFLFGDYEGFRRIQRAPQQATLPSAAQSSGTFVDASGNPIPITNPYTNAVYKNGVIPIAALQTAVIPGTSTPQISPLNTTVLADLPASALTSQTSGTGNNYTSFARGTEDSDKGDLRLDYYITPRMTSFVRYSQRRFNALDPAPIPAPIYSTAKGNINQDNKQLAAGYTLQLTAASQLDLRAGFTWSAGAQNPTSIGQPNLLAAAGEPNVPSNPSFANGLNTVTITGFTQFGRTNSLPTVVNPRIYNPKANYSILKGHHSFKFGYEYLYESSIVSNFKPVFGADTYGGKFSEGTAKAISTDPSYAEAWNLADFIFGARNKYELSALHRVEYNQRMHFLYGQDDWRVSNNLTLNLGLRYELATPPFETSNQLANFDPVASLTSGLVLARSGSIYNRATIRRNDLNLAPRLGLAFSANPKTVIRAAYGISYQQFLRAATANELAQNAPYNIDNVISQFTPFSKTSPQAVCTSLTAAPLSCFQPTQSGYLNNFLSTANYSPLSTTTTYDPASTPTTYVESYQISVQRQLANKMYLDVAYVGNHGVHEQILADYNEALPNAAGGSGSLQSRRPIQSFGAIQESFNGGPSLFNALEVKLEKRYSQGIFIANSFTWSHAQDVAGANQELNNGDGDFVDLYSKTYLARSGYDRPLNDSLAVVWDLPYGKGMMFGSSGAAPLQFLLGDWQMTAINSFVSGLPINITYAESTAQQVSTLPGFVYRPNLVGPPVLADGKRIGIRGQPGQYQYLDPTAVSVPTAANTPFGNAPRNVARAPGFADLDLGLHKRFPLRFEDAGLEFRAEAFNLLNRSNAQAPDSTATDSGYGVISSYYPSRELQLALKLTF